MEYDWSRRPGGWFREDEVLLPCCVVVEVIRSQRKRRYPSVKNKARRYVWKKRMQSRRLLKLSSDSIAFRTASGTSRQLPLDKFAMSSSSSAINMTSYLDLAPLLMTDTPHSGWKKSKKRKPMHFTFLDLEEAFDSLPRGYMLCLKRKGSQLKVSFCDVVLTGPRERSPEPQWVFAEHFFKDLKRRFESGSATIISPHDIQRDAPRRRNW